MIRSPLATLVLVLSVSFALSPALSAGFAGFTSTQFPIVQDRWPVQPVGWAFSIWGLIYLLLIASALFGLFRRPEDPQWQVMRLPLALSLGLGTFWIAVANWQPVAATVMIIFMTAGALAALFRAPREQRALVPVGLYAGWLTAATGIAVAIVLSGFDVISAQAAALLAIAGLLVCALAVQWRRPDAGAYGMAVSWALMGVIIANLDPANLPVIMLAGVGIAAMAALIILRKET